MSVAAPRIKDIGNSARSPRIDPLFDPWRQFNAGSWNPETRAGALCSTQRRKFESPDFQYDFPTATRASSSQVDPLEAVRRRPGTLQHLSTD